MIIRHFLYGLWYLICAAWLPLAQAMDSSDFLDPEQAYRFEARVAADMIEVDWTVAEGYYLYRDKLRFESKTPSIRLGAPALPPPTERKNDEFFGEQPVYRGKVTVRIPVAQEQGAPETFTLAIGSQGCADAGLCYPPVTRTVQLALKTGGAASGAASGADGEAALIPKQDRYAQSLASGNRLLSMLSFFGLGLLLAFTPCVLPMVPILSSIIVGQGQGITTRRAFFLSFAYVLAMAITYTIAGVIAGLFGANLQAAFQQPWIIGAFSTLFILLALSMFGVYDLQVPSRWQAKVAEISNRQQGGTLIGAGVMGLLSALIVGPCVAAPLAGALIYIGQTGDAVFGGMALFSLSLGMGAPLLAIGSSAGKWLPRAGGWMDTIKAAFGVLLLALAIWMLSRILPGQVTMLLWGALLIVSAVYMGAMDRLMPDDGGWRRLRKGTGLVSMVYGGVLMLGAAAGGTDVLQPLRGMNILAAGPGEAANATGLTFSRVKGVAGFEQALADARAAGKPVVLDFYADWCVSCKEMEHDTFSDPAVQRTLAQTVLLQADVTANDGEDQALLKRFGIFGPPSLMFFGADGAERRAYRLVGFMGPEEFAQHAGKALDEG